jgi:(2Fe-2S) ferredoxin
VLVCSGSTCKERGSDKVTARFRRAIEEHGLDPEVHTARTRCLGRCDDGCTVVVQPDNIWYREITPSLAERIVEEHLLDDCPVRKQVSFEPKGGELVQRSGVRSGKKKRKKK